jgi:hypothetical protein
MLKKVIYIYTNQVKELACSPPPNNYLKFCTVGKNFSLIKEKAIFCGYSETKLQGKHFEIGYLEC